MTKNRKILIAAILLTGLCSVSLAAVLLFNSPIFKPAEKSPTPVVISTIQTELNLSNLKITRTPFAGKRSIPFQSVVLITALYYENGSLQEGWTGSGTFITKDGLILTNAHVVLSDENFKVDMLTIAPTVSADEKPQPSYIAKVVQADASLDLAILKIASDLNGNPVDPKTLNFPAVKLGDSDSLTLGDKLTILGYPGIGGDTITLTSGEVAGFTGETGIGNRAFIKTSATIAGGNSGGLAANDAGELVGITTQLGSGSDTGIVDCRNLADTNGDGVIDENDTCIPTGGFINSLRPVNLARPLIEAAERGEVNILSDSEAPSTEESPDSGGVLYTDDFSTTNTGWTVQNDTDGYVGYGDRNYIIQVTSPQMILSGTSGYEAANVVIDVSVQGIQGTGKGDFGLICRQQSDGSNYAFEIREDGYASIWKNNSGTISPLVDWKYFPVVQQNSIKRLTAACVGRQLGLGIDGKMLISTSDSDFSSGDTGLIAGTWDTAGLTVAFDDFQIRSPK